MVTQRTLIYKMTSSKCEFKLETKQRKGLPNTRDKYMPRTNRESKDKRRRATCISKSPHAEMTQKRQELIILKDALSHGDTVKRKKNNNKASNNGGR